MNGRARVLRSALQELGVPVIFVDSSPSPAGIAFSGAAMVCKIEVLAVMAEALSDADFLAFSQALAQWALFALQFVADGQDSDLAGVLARIALQERDPRAVAVLDAVFDVEERG